MKTKKIKYLLHLLNIYISYLTRKQKVNYLPVKLWIEVSSKCNLKCRLCANKDMPLSEKGNMDFNLYKKIINEAKDYVYEINLFHRGEPLMHPQIIEMIKYAKQNNIKTVIHTNASLLNKDLSEKLIKSGLNKISFSFDGYTKTTYEKNRTGSKFEDVLNNIIDFLRIKKELNSKLPYTIIQVMEYDEDMSHLDFKIQKRKFTYNFNNLPLNKLIIRTPHNWGGSIDIKNIYSETYSGKKLYSKKNKTNMKKAKYSACTFPWYSLVILYNGKVLPCPQDFYGTIYLGDANNELLKVIFNNDKIQKLRERFKNKNIKNINDEIVCSSCDRCLRQTILGVPKEYLGKFLKDNLN